MEDEKEKTFIPDLTSEHLKGLEVCLEWGGELGAECGRRHKFCLLPEKASSTKKSNIVPYASDKTRRWQINLSYSQCRLLIVLSAGCRYNVKFSFPIQDGKSCG